MTVTLISAGTGLPWVEAISESFEPRPFVAFHRTDLPALVERYGRRLLIDAMNQCFRELVVDTATGGKGGGGAQITPFGRTVLKDFRARLDGIDPATIRPASMHSTGRKRLPPAKTLWRMAL